MAGGVEAGNKSPVDVDELNAELAADREGCFAHPVERKRSRQDRLENVRRFHRSLRATDNKDFGKGKRPLSNMYYHDRGPRVRRKAKE